MASIEERMDSLAGMLQQLGQQVGKLKDMQTEHGKALQQTRNIVEKLAALDDLEFIESLNEWVSKKKWAELKKDPR